jgi:lysozyme
MNPSNLALLIAELRRDEGVRYMPYADTAGHQTCGCGHNMDVSPLPIGWTFPLSDAQVDQLLTQDLQSTFKQLNASVSWWASLDDVRQRCIANVAFNIGVLGLLGFHNALFAMQRGSYAVAAAGFKASRWYGQVGARAQRICYAIEYGVMPDEQPLS